MVFVIKSLWAWQPLLVCLTLLFNSSCVLRDAAPGAVAGEQTVSVRQETEPQQEEDSEWKG